MSFPAQKLKAKMLELTQLFCIERNIFQKFVIVYKYIRLLNTDPLTKGILQKMFDDTAKTMGMFQGDGLDEDEFLDVKGEVIYSNEFWMYYSNLEVIHGKMKKLKSCQIRDKIEYDNLCRLFSKPYSKEMLALSLKIVNSNVFDRLDQDVFFDETEQEPKTWFDEEKSILHFKGEKIKINIKSKLTNAHKVLRHIFVSNKDNVGDDFFFSEIAEDEFGELDYKERKNNWRTYHRACKDINSKIEMQTSDEVTKFLLFNTGRKGSVKINKAYL